MTKDTGQTALFPRALGNLTDSLRAMIPLLRSGNLLPPRNFKVSSEDDPRAWKMSKT